MNKQNILFLFLNNEIRTGGHRRLLELCEDMAKRGHTVTGILNRDLDYTSKHFHTVRISCPYIRNKGGSLSKRFSRAIAQMPSDALPQNMDTVMIHGETHLRAAREVLKRVPSSFIFAQRSNTIREHLTILRDSEIGLLSKLRALTRIAVTRVYEAQITRLADRILFQSTYDEQDFITRNPKAKGKTRIIPGNIGLPRFIEKYENTNTSSECRRLLFVGTLGVRKGLLYLLKAFEILSKRGYDTIRLDIIGSGNWNKWEEEMKDTGVLSRIHYHGKVKNPFTYIVDADLVILPSIFDSFPDSVLEAIHTGTLVIGSRAGGIPDILKHDELLFPVQDSMAIADIIEKCIQSTEYFQHLRKLCRERAPDFHFDWTQRWLDILSEAGLHTESRGD